jgi:hypothetical protein
MENVVKDTPVLFFDGKFEPPGISRPGPATVRCLVASCTYHGDLQSKLSSACGFAVECVPASSFTNLNYFIYSSRDLVIKLVAKLLDIPLDDLRFYYQKGNPEKLPVRWNQGMLGKPSPLYAQYASHWALPESDFRDLIGELADFRDLLAGKKEEEEELDPENLMDALGGERRTVSSHRPTRLLEIADEKKEELALGGERHAVPSHRPTRSDLLSIGVLGIDYEGRRIVPSGCATCTVEDATSVAQPCGHVAFCTTHLHAYRQKKYASYCPECLQDETYFED